MSSHSRARLDYARELGTTRAKAVLEERCSAGYDTNELGCWLFRGSKNSSGYGQVYLKTNSNMHRTGRQAQTAMTLHNVAFLAHNGHAASLHCSHLCDNRACFNPTHLVDESATFNNARKGCWGDIFCPEHGHPIVQFCEHRPKCMRETRHLADKIHCCLSLREQAQDHSSDPVYRGLFTSDTTPMGRHSRSVSMTEASEEGGDDLDDSLVSMASLMSLEPVEEAEEEPLVQLATSDSFGDSELDREFQAGRLGEQGTLLSWRPRGEASPNEISSDSSSSYEGGADLDRALTEGQLRVD